MTGGRFGSTCRSMRSRFQHRLCEWRPKRAAPGRASWRLNCAAHSRAARSIWGQWDVRASGRRPPSPGRPIFPRRARHGGVLRNMELWTEVHGAGQPQLRNLKANVAAWHLALWLHTLVELWAWDRTHAELCDRRASPWDDPTRRPSHADRCKALRRKCMHAEFSRRTPFRSREKIRAFFDRLAQRAA